MKKKITVCAFLVAALLVSAFTFICANASTENDPLISLSYLEQIIIPSLKQEIMTEVNATVDQKVTDTLNGDMSQNVGTAPAPEVNIDEIASSINVSYTLLELTCGQTITADGICELIVRPGSVVTMVSPFAEQGMADITNGTEVLDGQEVAINAYCLIPRGCDGRGVKVESEKAYIMIRGEYTIG